MRNHFEIQEYFTDKEIIKILCHKRAIIAKKNHDNHFYRNISKKAKSPHYEKKKEFLALFPPRNKWIRLNKLEREKRNSNSVETNSIQLERTIWREIKKCKRLNIPYPTWLTNLLDFITDIRESFIDEKIKYKISKPKTIPILKDYAEKTFRPLSIFNLKDLIIIGQTSRYLSNCFDILFCDSSYAFRTGIQKNKIFNHHKAIDDIITFKNKVNKPLFVTECDIKKFYDCVNHKCVKEEFDLLCKEVKNKHNIEINERSKFIFHSYLASFSFNKDVKKK